jgi:hypothetical protein
LAIFVLPNERATIEVRGSASRFRLLVEPGPGHVATVTLNRWTWQAPGAPGDLYDLFDRLSKTAEGNLIGGLSVYDTEPRHMVRSCTVMFGLVRCDGETKLQDCRIAGLQKVTFL